LKVIVTITAGYNLDHHILARISDCGWSISFKSKESTKNQISKSDAEFEVWDDDHEYDEDDEDDEDAQYTWDEFDWVDNYYSEGDNDYEEWTGNASD
jgi:hypothetical protein